MGQVDGRSEAGSPKGGGGPSVSGVSRLSLPKGTRAKTLQDAPLHRPPHPPRKSSLPPCLAAMSNLPSTTPPPPDQANPCSQNGYRQRAAGGTRDINPPVLASTPPGPKPLVACALRRPKPITSRHNVPLSQHPRWYQFFMYLWDYSKTLD